MLVLLIGAAIVFLLFCLAFYLDDDLSPKLILLAIGIGILTILLAFFQASGYKEPKLKEEIELVSLSDSVSPKGGGFIFVNVSPDNTYSYRYKVESDYTKDNTDKSTAYKKNLISGQMVTEVEEEDCPTPKLEIYEIKSKITWWTFGFFSSYEEYVFRVPKGSISHTVNLE